MKIQKRLAKEPVFQERKKDLEEKFDLAYRKYSQAENPAVLLTERKWTREEIDLLERELPASKPSSKGHI